MRTSTERAESSLNIARGAGLAVDLNGLVARFRT